MLLTNIMYITQTISTVSADTVIDEIVEIVFREKTCRQRMLVLLVTTLANH